MQQSKKTETAGGGELLDDLIIREHFLYMGGSQVPFKRSPNQTSKARSLGSQTRPFDPKGIVLHDTAGRLEKGSSVRWFLQKKAKASAHFVIERDGSLTQQVALDCKAWHAGKSAYKGRTGVNDFAFGLELVNPGRCTQLADGRFKPWFEERFKEGENGLHFAYKATKSHGSGWWLAYSKEQIEVTIALCQRLTEDYRLEFITTHYEISPGRKTDPNPLFPLERVKQAIKEIPPDKKDRRAFLPADSPMRRWPSYHDNVIMTVPAGAELDIIRKCHFENEAVGGARDETAKLPKLWCLCAYASHEGWIEGEKIQSLGDRGD
ncbi:MAG: N-acetylmuramoyl-L-alanine amidase [Cohaesibacter sp.]|nr:N-acetylmuramoyl-L-alanine amidase [Cohaesibacter sp.]